MPFDSIKFEVTFGESDLVTIQNIMNPNRKHKGYSISLEMNKQDLEFKN